MLVDSVSECVSYVLWALTDVLTGPWRVEEILYGVKSLKTVYQHCGTDSGSDSGLVFIKDNLTQPLH